MLVTGLPLENLQLLTRQVSMRKYANNVIVHPDAHDLSGNRFQGRLWVADSSGPGARRSWSGRRLKATCWHAYRDVLQNLFDHYPDATVRTGLAIYRGRDGFMSTYPNTAYMNVGSDLSPVTMPELCECEAQLREYTQRAQREWVSSADSMSADTSQPYILDRIDDTLREISA